MGNANRRFDRRHVVSKLFRRAGIRPGDPVSLTRLAEAVAQLEYRPGLHTSAMVGVSAFGHRISVRPDLPRAKHAEALAWGIADVALRGMKPGRGDVHAARVKSVEGELLRRWRAQG
jgi:hypothetical protein